MKIHESQLREYERKNPYLKDFFDLESWEAWENEDVYFGNEQLKKIMNCRQKNQHHRSKRDSISK